MQPRGNGSVMSLLLFIYDHGILIKSFKLVITIGLKKICNNNSNNKKNKENLYKIYKKSTVC